MVDIVNEIYFCCKYVLYLLVFMYFTYFIAFCNILSFVRYIPRQIFLCSRKILYSFKMPRSHFQYHMSHIFKTKYDKKKNYVQRVIIPQSSYVQTCLYFDPLCFGPFLNSREVSPSLSLTETDTALKGVLKGVF